MVAARQLWWSEGGVIGCAQPGHRPYPGTDTWVNESWAPVPPEHARMLECEVCRIAAPPGPRSVISLAHELAKTLIF